MKKRPAKLSALLTGSIFTIQLITNTTVALFFFAAIALGHLESPFFPFLAALLYILVTALIGLVLSRLAVRDFFSRLTALAAAMRRVAGGEYGTRVGESREIAELSDMERSFNTMAGELESTELMRTDFVQNVSHEFKTPLAAISGYAELLEDGGLDEEQRAAYAREIRKGAKRLSGLTGDILLLSRIDHTGAPIEKEEYRLDEQLREVILACDWDAKGIEPDVELERMLLRGNEALLERAFSNLVGNAYKYTPAHGRVHITLRAEDGAVISVSDSGPGIDPGEQKRIFEKFYRGKSAVGSEGNGLGLALAAKIVSLHGGTITVESAPGEGSTFTVRLPQA